MEKAKKRWGDRKDGALIRDLDGMHFIVPIIYPNRCDNEAFISERIDLTHTREWLSQKNGSNPAMAYKLFQVVVAATLKVILLRPKMNRFIANKNFYQRKGLSASFVVKKQFKDEAHEGLAFVHAREDMTIEDIRKDIYRQITDVRSGKGDASSDAMDMFNKMPRFLSKFIIFVITRLDVHGHVPQSLIDTDPYYSSAVLSNLGSIGVKSAYHHLTNWGTNSVFVAVGEAKNRPFYKDDGSVEMRYSLDLGLTIDERLADGYYYSKTIKMLKHLIENPELLEAPLSQDFEIK